MSDAATRTHVTVVTRPIIFIENWPTLPTRYKPLADPTVDFDDRTAEIPARRNHLARTRRATPNAIRRATSPISTAANCRWLELLPETTTPFWLCGIAYDSR
jgi:hypothetical protein